MKVRDPLRPIIEKVLDAGPSHRLYRSALSAASNFHLHESSGCCEQCGDYFEAVKTLRKAHPSQAYEDRNLS